MQAHLQRASSHRKPEQLLQPSNSLDSATTAQQQHGSPQSTTTSTVVGGGSTSSLCASLLSEAQDALSKPRLDPNAAKLAIKEALAPLSAAELAAIQQQLRESRLARQQEAWSCCGGSGGGFHVPQHHQQQQQSSFIAPPACSFAPAGAGEVGNMAPMVHQVASALANGHLSSSEVSRVLSTLDPSVFRPLPPQLQHQQLLQHPLQQHAGCWMPPQRHQAHQPYQHQQQWARHGGPLVPPPAIPMMSSPPTTPFYSSQLPARVGGVVSAGAVPAAAPRQRVRLAPASVAAPYSAVLDNLQLPPAALAAHAAAASAAAAAAAAANKRLRHPGSSLAKGRRSCRTRARCHLGSLVRSVSTASDVAGHLAVNMLDQPQLPTTADDPLLMLAAEAGQTAPSCQRWDSINSAPTPGAAAAAAEAAMPSSQGDSASLPAAAAAIGARVRDDAAHQHQHSPAVALDTSAEHGCCHVWGGHEYEEGEDEDNTPVPPHTSLRARFARLSPAVQGDILRQLDELAALDEELLRGAGPGSSSVSPARDMEPQGPRRSSRARKVRDWENGGFTATGSNRSASPTPPPSQTPQGENEHDHHMSGRSTPKRMRLDASSTGAPRHSADTQQQQDGQQRAAPTGANSLEADMLPALDLHLFPEPEVYVAPSEAPRKRRVPRKVGPRASARKRMHRATFKRGKPQRSPAA